jgi:starch-binding outer membrane protein, SusD/RagB family
MKSIFTKFRILLTIIALSLATSCSIEDVKPLNALTEQNVVKDVASAQLLLNGAYNQWRFDEATAFLSILGADASPIFSDPKTDGAATNSVRPDNDFVTSYYTQQYAIINQANFLIEALEAGKAKGIAEKQLKEMLSEAKFHRAMAHFHLLRLFGQFYDQSSEFGIVIKTKPTREVEVAARSNVSQSFASIIEDLSFAKANGPVGVRHLRISQTTASALLSKVYLYKGDYTKAATEALSVIDNADGYALEAAYPDIFANRYDSKEVLFVPYVNGALEGNNSFVSPSFTAQSFTLIQLADSQIEGAGDDFTGEGYDPRYGYTYAFTTSGPNNNGKYPFPLRDQSNSLPASGIASFYLRMGEVYLIYAEAKARLVNGSAADTDAITYVNAIRARAGVDLAPIASATKAELLMAIREEKVLELFLENGEPWFDIVRYDRLNDLSAVDIKPTITNVNKLIMPIGLSVKAGNSLLIQNPGY